MRNGFLMAKDNYSVVRIQRIGFEQATSRVRKIAERDPGLSYLEMYEAVASDSSVYTAGFSRSMSQLGNDTSEIFFDCEPLQKQWARENGLRIQDTDNWEVEIALAQLRKISPEVIYFQDIFTLPAALRRDIKKLVPSVRLSIIQKGYPGETRDLSDADILLVSSPILFERYRHQEPHLVYHSFDSSVGRVKSRLLSGPCEPLIFAGSTRAPEDRYWMLRRLLAETPIQMWIDEDLRTHKRHGGLLNVDNWKRILRRKIVEEVRGKPSGVLKATFSAFAKNSKARNILTEAARCEEVESELRELPDVGLGLLPAKTLCDEFPTRCHSSVFGQEYYDLLSRAQIVFNMHSSQSRDTVDNMKMFEATGMGACLLTDTGRNMKDLFDEDYEVVTYCSADEAIEKAKYLIENPEEAQTVATAGRARTMACHTMAHRCQEIDEIIRSRL